ncbi:MAG: ribosome-associated translation inhibitor RaiA [Pseudomonadota bacterium]
MEIRITGRHVELGDSLRQHIEARLLQAVDKYFSRAISSLVTFGKEGHNFHAECSIHVNQGVTLQAEGTAGDAYAAFDVAAEKAEKQLRRYKRRLKNHHSTTNDLTLAQAGAYILAPEADGDDSQTPSQGTSSVDTPAQDPIIIAETKTMIPTVSVGDAVMLMDLADAPAFMFRNSKSEELNVVYRRPDGNIGWIDPAAGDLGA